MSDRNFERERGRPAAKREHSRDSDEHLPPHQRRRHDINQNADLDRRQAQLNGNQREQFSDNHSRNNSPYNHPRNHNRGGYQGGNNDNRGGYVNRGGYGNRGGDNDINRGGYGNRGGGSGFNDNKRSIDYNAGSEKFENKDRAANDNRQDYYGNNRNDDRGGGFSNRGGGRGGGGRGGSRGGYSGNNGGGFHSVEVCEPGPIELCSNFFQISCMSNNADWILYQYHVSFSPDIKSKGLRFGLLKNHDSLFNNSKAFDGANLYSLVKLPNKKTVIQSLMQRENTVVDITIDLVKEIFPGDDQTIQIFNIIFKRCLKRCDYKEFGKERAYFDFNDMTRLTNTLNIISGYKASIEIYGRNLFLCTELASKLINQSTVLDRMEELYTSCKGVFNDYKAEVEKELIGQTVITNYNKRSYKIDDIAWDMNPSQKFKLRNGDEISFVQYYKDHYKLNIINQEQPLLISRPKQKDINRGESSEIQLVPEFCALTGQHLMNPRDFTLKKQIDGITKLNPQERFRRLTTFLQKIKNSKEAQKDFNDWQMKLGDDLVNLTGQVLKPVGIVFKDTNPENPITDTVNGWDNKIKNAIHLNAIPLNHWCIFFMERDQPKADHLRREIIQLAKPMGFQIWDPIMIKLGGRNSDGLAYVNEIRGFLKNCKEQPQLILCIIQSNDKKVYSAIKKTCCIDFSVPTQIITQKLIEPNNNKTKSVLTKVAIQMNCKLGGEIWGISLPTKSLMIIGMDLYKDSSDRNKSAFAFVASMNGDKNCSRFFSRVVMQHRKANYCDHLQILMQSALTRYSELNEYLPETIIIYRDGVGDSQLKDVRDHEIDNQIRNAFTYFKNYMPKLTFIVVQKRGNTRFFYKSNGQYVNAPMGTVVDNTVTGRKINRSTKPLKRKSNSPVVIKQEEGIELNEITMSDFYLVSQSVRQGTVSPSHFRVIVNEHPKLQNAQSIQTITYKLTHMYYNWPGQIRVPAVCQYAHKLAHLVGESLHNEHHPGLENLLFYL